MATVHELHPPACEECGKPLTTQAEQNRRLDYGLAWCDACHDDEERNACWCSYGYFFGGDPRQWTPDEEMNTPEEIARWLALCEAWERGEHVEPAAEEHGPWVDQETGQVTIGVKPAGNVLGMCHAPRSLGIGSTYCDQHKAPSDSWKRWRDAARPAATAEQGGGE